MGMILYPTIYAWCSKNRPAFWNQGATWYIGMWTFLCGVFTILVMVVTYNCYSKKNGLDLAERGVKISGRKLWKTIVLVFISDYLFLTDFRLWCFITIRAFAPMHFATIAKYLVFWLVYYIALSVATNGFNFVQLGKSKWLSTLVQMFFVFIGPELMIGVQAPCRLCVQQDLQEVQKPLHRRHHHGHSRLRGLRHQHPHPGLSTPTLFLWIRTAAV